MALNDSSIQNRGLGKWKIYTYNPGTCVGGIDGILIVGKDFHVIYKDEKMNVCLFNIPSQNVAFVINENHVIEGKNY
jgi:hypothetical protein